MWISSSPNCWNFDVKTNLPFCTTFRADICPSLSPIESHVFSSCTSTLGGSWRRLLARHSRNEKQLDIFFWTEFPCFFSFGTSIRADRKSGVPQKLAPVLYTIALLGILLDLSHLRRPGHFCGTSIRVDNHRFPRSSLNGTRIHWDTLHCQVHASSCTSTQVDSNLWPRALPYLQVRSSRRPQQSVARVHIDPKIGLKMSLDSALLSCRRFGFVNASSGFCLSTSC